VRIRQIKLFAAIEADFICPAFDRENTAQVTVTTAEHELKDPTQSSSVPLSPRSILWLQSARLIKSEQITVQECSTLGL
jgi:hypothetical protein